MKILRFLLLTFLFIPLCLFLQVSAQEVQPQDSQDIEAARSKILKRWSAEGLVKPADVEVMAKAVLYRPLVEQSTDKLRVLAAKANTAANLVDFISVEYKDYYRENYRYKFVQEQVAPFHDAYIRLSNRLKSYRDRAYLNLGKKAAQRGDDLLAFLMFRDAYRLSSFVESRDGDPKGVRYQAEIEMKKLLGLEEMDTFTIWE